jgi:hypothetical protein
MRSLILFFSIFFFICGCVTSPPAKKPTPQYKKPTPQYKKPTPQYKKPTPYLKKSDSTERKAGPAMILYEQAEEDLDPHNVIVIPPDKKQDKTSAE